MTIWGERFAALAGVAFSVFVIYVAKDFPANGEIFPNFCGFAMVFIAALMVLRTVSSPAVFDGKWPSVAWFEEAKPLLITGATVAYVLLFFVVGYYVSSAIFLCTVAWMAGVRSVRAIAITTVVTFPLMYAFFELFLQARMPRGFLV